MKNIEELVDHDIEFKNNLIAYNLYSFVFDKANSENAELIIDETRLDAITRSELPNSNIKTLMILYILFKNKSDHEYLQIVSDKFGLPTIDIFYFNALLGRISILELLMEKEPTILALPQTKTMPKAYPIGLLQESVLQWLQCKDPQFLQSLLEINDRCYFEQACGEGQIDALKWMEINLPKLLDKMFSLYINDAFAKACAHLPILLWIENKATNEKLQELIEKSYKAFSWACLDNNVEVARWFKSKIPSDVLKNLISKREYELYHNTISGKRFEITKLLLWDLDCFLYADKCRKSSFGGTLNQFIDEELDQIKKSNTVGTIIDPGTIKLYFYMARNIIRGEQKKHLERLQLLLSIPALKALAHEEVTPKTPNELMQVALLHGNFSAADELLKIEAVRTATVDNAFYYTNIPAGNLYHKFLCWLKKTNRTILNAILSKDIQPIFKQAYTDRHINTLELLKSIKPKTFHQLIVAASMVTADSGLKIAAYRGDITFLDWLKNTLTQEEFENAITAVGAEAFKGACGEERIGVLDWFNKVVSPKVLLSMMQYENYHFFRVASVRNKVKTLQWIKQAVDSNLLNRMIAYNSFEAFNIAPSESRKWLLWNPACFAYAEQSQNYEELVHLHALAVVKDLQLELKAHHRQQIIDLQYSEKAKLCFYILRHLIGCQFGENENKHAFIFLLAIPAVNSLRKPNAEGNDELMKLATSKKNTLALDLLSRTIPQKNAGPNEHAFYKKNNKSVKATLGKHINNNISTPNG